MSKQPPGSPADQALDTFIGQVCPGAKKILEPFVGFRLGETEFLYKKGEYSLQKRKGREYGNFYFRSAVYPSGVASIPPFIVFHSTDSKKALRLSKRYDDAFFFDSTENLQNNFGEDKLKRKRGISASESKSKWKLGKEFSADRLKSELEKFVSSSAVPSKTEGSQDVEIKISPEMAPPAIKTSKIVAICITGASGAVYAQSILRLLDGDPRVERVHLVASEAGLRLIATELDIVAQEPKKLPSLLTGTSAAKIEYLPNRDVGASIASGSAHVDAMAVIPCSAGALGAIASGTSDDLLTRAADVCLKERRTLVLCLRETPLNRIHLENMLRAHDAGAVVMPAMPAFYYGPATMGDLVDQYVYRVLAQLGLPQEKQYHWQGGAPSGGKSGKKS